MIDKEDWLEPRSIQDLYTEEDIEELHRGWTTDPKNLADMQKIVNLMPKDVTSVLDYGCGTGRYSQHFKDYTGVDISPAMVAFARRTYPGKNFYAQMDFHKLHSTAPIFDLVMAVSVIQYWNDEQALKIISDMAALSRKYLLIQTWDVGETGSRRFQMGFKGVGEYVRSPSFYFAALLKFGDVVRGVLEAETGVHGVRQAEHAAPSTEKVVYMAKKDEEVQDGRGGSGSPDKVPPSV